MRKLFLIAAVFLAIAAPAYCYVRLQAGIAYDPKGFGLALIAMMFLGYVIAQGVALFLYFSWKSRLYEAAMIRAILTNIGLSWLLPSLPIIFMTRPMARFKGESRLAVYFEPIEIIGQVVFMSTIIWVPYMLLFGYVIHLQRSRVIHV